MGQGIGVTLEGSTLGWLLSTSRTRPTTSSRVRWASWEDIGRASHRAMTWGWPAAAVRGATVVGKSRMWRRIAGRRAAAAISLSLSFSSLGLLTWPEQGPERSSASMLFGSLYSLLMCLRAECSPYIFPHTYSIGKCPF